MAFFEAELQHSWEFITSVSTANDSCISALPDPASAVSTDSSERGEGKDLLHACSGVSQASTGARPRSLVLAVLLAKEVNEWGHLFTAVAARAVELGWNPAALAGAPCLPLCCVA
jgi:hypothetical protein